jgi:uncharacterized membrane-anchored protein
LSSKLPRLAKARKETVRNRKLWLLAAVLAALLVAATWYCVSIWRATPAMPLYGNIIMAVAAILALVAGCGLIALVFYSHRKGYDEPGRGDRTFRK